MPKAKPKTVRMQLLGYPRYTNQPSRRWLWRARCGRLWVMPDGVTSKDSEADATRHAVAWARRAFGKDVVIEWES